MKHSSADEHHSQERTEMEMMSAMLAEMRGHLMMALEWPEFHRVVYLLAWAIQAGDEAMEQKEKQKKAA